jgi:hypothetical protein
MAQRRVSVTLHSDMGERLDGNLSIGHAWTFEQAHGAVAAHHDRLEHRDGEIAIHYTLLREVADLGSVVTPQLVARAVKDMKMSTERSHQPKDGFAEGGFPGAVGTDDAHEFSRVDRQCKVFQRDDAGKSE